MPGARTGAPPHPQTAQGRTRSWAGDAPRQRALHGDAPLDDHVGAHERDPRVVEQVPQDRGRGGKRQVRDDSKRLAGKLDGRGVGVDHFDVLPAAQARRQAAIQLDGDHAPSHPRELGGQPAGAGSEIEHKVVAAQPGVANELRGERPRTKEMLATRAAGPARRSCARLGHGPSPS